MRKIVADRKLWRTADNQVVEDGDPAARFLLASRGRTIPEAVADALGISVKKGRIVYDGSPKLKKPKRSEKSAEILGPPRDPDIDDHRGEATGGRDAIDDPKGRASDPAGRHGPKGSDPDDSPVVWDAAELERRREENAEARERERDRAAEELAAKVAAKAEAAEEAIATRDAELDEREAALFAREAAVAEAEREAELADAEDHSDRNSEDVPEWTGRTSPEAYVRTYPNGPRADDARAVIAAEEAAEQAARDDGADGES